MSPKKMLSAIAAVALGIAGAVSSAQAGSKDGYQARQGIQEPSHLSFTTDVGRAYALDESSKSNKKAPKHEKTGPTSTSGAPARAESDEAARLRRYQDNR